MFDKEMVLESLYNISNALGMIQERTAPIKCADDFISSPGGTLRLEAPAKGLNIVKYSDGSVKKVVVQ